MNSEERAIKEILQGLEEGTMIYVRDNESSSGVLKAKFIKMNRTRFTAECGGFVWSCCLLNYLGTCEDVDNNKPLNYTLDKKMPKYKKFKFIEKNNNVNGLSTGDCAVRGISELFNITWSEAMMKLAETSCNTGLMPDAEKNINKLLEDNGYKKLKFKKISIIDFVERYAEPNKKYAIHTKDHFTVVKGYSLIDTWDSGNDEATMIFEMEDK